MDFGYKLHYLLNNNIEEVESLLVGIDILQITNNSILTNIIQYYIKSNHDNLQIVRENLAKFNLHKRDYLNLSAYYYEKDYEYSSFLFSKILSNHHTIQSNDVDYLIERKLYKLIRLLRGVYCESTIDITHHNTLALTNHTITNHTSEFNSIQHLIGSKINGKILEDFYHHIKNTNYQYIVDGGNVLHYGGKITKQNINNLKQIINMHDGLVILHTRHIKRYPELLPLLNRSSYYLTPYQYDDDLFIILAFLHHNSWIISNDRYRDHLFKYKENNTQYMRFKNILAHHTLQFNNKVLVQSSKHCIEIQDDKILVPHISKQFILLKVWEGGKETLH